MTIRSRAGWRATMEALWVLFGLRDRGENIMQVELTRLYILLRL